VVSFSLVVSLQKELHWSHRSCKYYSQKRSPNMKCSPMTVAMTRVAWLISLGPHLSRITPHKSSECSSYWESHGTYKRAKYECWIRLHSLLVSSLCTIKFLCMSWESLRISFLILIEKKDIRTQKLMLRDSQDMQRNLIVHKELTNRLWRRIQHSYFALL
jgi:hypothetical protein